MAHKRKRKKRLASRDEVEKVIRKVVETATPHTILGAINKIYKKYPSLSRSAAEQEFWIKCERSTGNLASGMEKWLEEMIDEEG